MFAVVVALLDAALVFSVGAHALGGSPVLIVPKAPSPTVDGSISPSREWADASKLRIPFERHPAILYVKHTDTQLYFLLAVADDPPAGGIKCCTVSVYFDNNVNGVRDTGEDEMGFGPGNQSSDQFFGTIAGVDTPQYIDDILGGGADNTATAGSYDPSGKRLILEARKALCSGDPHDFCLKDGATVGFTLEYFNSAGDATVDYPAGRDDLGRYAELEISPKPLAADVATQVTANKTSINAGESVTLTVTAGNKGPDAATNTILDAVYEAKGVTAKLPPEVCGCELGTLAAGTTSPHVRTITPTSVAIGGGTISVSGATFASEPDPDESNDTAELSVKVSSAPAAGEAVTAKAAAGTVSVRTSGTRTFVPLGPGASIATGSEVDASRGRVRITSATPSRKLQSATASAGRFQVTQAKRQALTQLRLTAPTTCGPGAGTTVLRRLEVDAGGNFRTAGARGWAMPEDRQARWLTVDYCVPVGRKLASASAKPKRTKRTCYTNLSKRSDICVKDPERPKEKMVPPKKKMCV